MRELAHELRDALSPLASSADLARLRKFDPESARLLAEKVERGLRRALALLDAFVLAELLSSPDPPAHIDFDGATGHLSLARGRFFAREGRIMVIRNGAPVLYSSRP